MSSGAKKFFNVADLPYSHPRSTPSQPPHSFSPALRLIVPLSRFLVHGIPMDNPHILASAACQFHYNLAVQLVNERVSSQSTAPTFIRRLTTHSLRLASPTCQFCGYWATKILDGHAHSRLRMMTVPS